MLLGASGGSAGGCNETGEGQDMNARETNDTGSLLHPPFDDGASVLHRHQTCQSHCNPNDQDEIAQNADGLRGAGSRSHLDEDETKSDSDRGDDVKHAGSD